ncbi:MAG: protein kinase domain-containing protein [Pseudonocardiaceae bacterium]
MTHDSDVVPELPGYRVLSRLGHGTMGVVYLAEDVQLRREVALKVLAPTLVDQELFRQRFDRESHSAATLDHPHIIPIYAAGAAAGARYIAMRYVAGGDLRTLIETTGPLSLTQMTAVIVAMADALDAAHAQGIVHRDVKPANILVDNRGGQEHYYLSDFGIARNISAGASLTSTGQVMGTIDYLAPEQVQGKPVDGRADLYALGCVLYHCLTGAVPFPRDDIAALMWAHVHEEPPPVTTRRPELPAELDRIVAKAMAKQPAERYPTGRELALALRGLSAGPMIRDDGGEPVDDPPLGSAGVTGTYTALVPPPARAPGTTAAPRRRWWLLAGCGLLAAALVAGSTVAILKYLGPGFPTPAEQTLRDQLPRKLATSCQRNPYTGRDAAAVAASVICRPDGDLPSVVLTKFTSAQALADHYHADLEPVGINQNSGNCREDPSAEGPYTSESKKNRKQTSGNIFCYQDRDGASLEWTEKSSQTLGLMTLGLATRNDPDPTTLWDWWAKTVGMQPRTPPTAEATHSPASPPPMGPVPAAAAPEASPTDQSAKAYPTRRHPFQPPNELTATPATPRIPATVPDTPPAIPSTPADTRTAPNTFTGPTSAPTPSSTPVPSKSSATTTLDSPTPNAPDPDHISKPVVDGSGGCRKSKDDSKTYECIIVKTAYLYHPGATKSYHRLQVEREIYDFLCQSAGPTYSDKNGTSRWWAWVGDNTGTAWVSVTSLAGWHDGAQPGLPVCGNSPATNDSQPPGS